MKFTGMRRTAIAFLFTKLRIAVCRLRPGTTGIKKAESFSGQ